jgi:hypothetical protein
MWGRCILFVSLILLLAMLAGRAMISLLLTIQATGFWLLPW